MKKEPTPILRLEPILKALHREGVQFVLVGGVAGIAHGMNYVTTDLDICYDRSPKNLTALVKCFQSVEPKLRTPGESVNFLFDERTLKNGLNFTLRTKWGDIDLLGEIAGIGNYKTFLPDSIETDFYGVTVKMISLDDLIKAKKAAGRTKDKLHLLELEAIREIHKVQEEE